MSDKAETGGTFYAFWMFQWAFAAASATIVSGAVAERCDFRAYLMYTTVITAFIYPVVVHWVWSTEGWLSHTGDRPLGANGLIDYGGSGVVHMCGGCAALMGAFFLGPRHGRFDVNGEVQDFPGHSTVLATLGTFILWFGWYGFNPVSSLTMELVQIASKIAVNTTLAPAAGGLMSLTFYVALGNPVDVAPCLNGILAGLVAITAPCAVVEPYAAFIIGVTAALVYNGASRLLFKLQIDDPLDAAPVHMCCGAWGLVTAGLFANQDDTIKAYGFSTEDYGLFYGGGVKQFGTQIVGLISIMAWSCGTSALLFIGLTWFKILRVPSDHESEGLDRSHHGGPAYNFHKDRDNGQETVRGKYTVAHDETRGGGNVIEMGAFSGGNFVRVAPPATPSTSTVVPLAQ
mmetsp:Transcript_12151/g.16566  ORF Transcript_12151/g.16566 Transcript_12151/m.16566 type:complete len:402 (-) Transcript_12151:194-1399(-)|eukprot:CAMPEP_0196576184 /NCGR_PEP_ID=MMETSP1081-20130531/5510_1 /TAXON_ID=36882 /ORGANISM="Pyramimonas amylifera, Strain CCMP720" /LENGTH=401 /DNA_ID=CAMNT_0041894725 /DNA_START=331 /DNA_END=1536 /DNA_ORIENTATION=-